MAIEATFVRPILFTIYAFGREFPVYTFGFFLLWAFYVPFFLTDREMTRINSGIDAGELIIWAINGGIVGSKGLYLVTLDRIEWTDVYSSTGFSYQGGLILGIILVFISVLHQKSEHVDLLQVSEAIYITIPAGLAVGKVGCFFSGDGCYGLPTDLPWGISFPNGLEPTTDFVHPTPIYEFATCVAIFAFVWSRRFRAEPHTQMALTNLLMGVCRFFVEFVRRHQKDGLFGITSFQQIALGQAAAGVLQIILAAFLKSRSNAKVEEKDAVRSVRSAQETKKNT